MGQNKKLIILIVLVILSVMVWMPKGRRRANLAPVSPQPTPALLATAPQITPEEGKRTRFSEWGRNPFIWYREGSSVYADLTLTGIIWDQEAPYALINGEVVRTGEEIAGKIVLRIDADKVILSDGSTKYILKLE